MTFGLNPCLINKNGALNYPKLSRKTSSLQGEDGKASLESFFLTKAIVFAKLKIAKKAFMQTLARYAKTKLCDKVCKEFWRPGRPCQSVERNSLESSVKQKPLAQDVRKSFSLGYWNPRPLGWGGCQS
jgi:hypothetical protein